MADTIVPCSFCGQLNRVPTLAPGKAALCGRCKNRLDDDEDLDLDDEDDDEDEDDEDARCRSCGQHPCAAWCEGQ